MKESIKKILIIIPSVFISFNVAAHKDKADGEFPGHPGPSPEKILSMMDANSDGLIAQAEAQGPLQHHFDTMDINKDGYLNLEEINHPPKPDCQPDGDF